MKDSTARFSGRAENYVKYRPRYPQQVIETLVEDCGMTGSSIIADIGAGTGVLAEMLLKNGNIVYAVEPNAEMRREAERLLEGYPGFHSMEGRAEETGIKSGSVDFVVVGQAFHWFDVPRARSEFQRILRHPGWGMVVWNEREYETSPFLIAYDSLLKRYAPEYARETHRRVYDTALGSFFGLGGFKTRQFSYRQELDLDGVKGRMLSSSYTPASGHPNHEILMAELARVYREHEANGRVALDYKTWMYYGQFS